MCLFEAYVIGRKNLSTAANLLWMVIGQQVNKSVGGYSLLTSVHSKRGNCWYAFNFYSKSIQKLRLKEAGIFFYPDSFRSTR